ncbi:hypothetical protein V498_01084 [Pseudogymnoascus sp. VKM F-4517 (FW-2822)]|nr:hypothetical protein V498_01084 [Pseudogymnoascus sp. VKM F-4517 (FW-2822)]
MDVIIAVMGITGSGKSSFIESVTGRKDLAGDSLRSETSNIQSYHLTIESTRFVLIDTPGFDDTFGSDADILKLVEEWLTSSYKSNCLLSGLLYLHPVNKPRVDGSSLRSLKLFRALCGEKNFANVVIGTTFWDSIGDLRIGLQREKELCESADFWGPMMRKGSRVVRFLSRDYSTAAGILLDMAKKSPCVFQIQEETVIQGKSLQDTSAGIVANPTPSSTLGVLANEVQATLALQAEKVQRGVERKYEQQAEQMRLELEKINLAEAEERRSREAEIKRRNEAQERALEKARRAAQQVAAQENKLAAEMEHLRCENERRDMLMRSEDALMRFNRTKVQQEEVQRQVELLRWGMGQNLVAVRADPTAYAALTRWCDKCQMNIGAEKYYCEIFLPSSSPWLWKTLLKLTQAA